MSFSSRTETLRQRLPRPETWIALLTAALFLALLLMIGLTFRDYGIGWDERVQAIYGQKLLTYYLSLFHDQSAFSYSDLHFYGGCFDLIAAAVNRFSPFGEFDTRHLLGALIFLVGLMGAWRLTTLLAGKRAALIAVACLASTPALYGHAFINPKDSPFAWLLIWVTYFTCRLLEPNRKASWGVYLGFALSLGMALGTKVFALAYVGYFIGVVSLGALIAWRQQQLPDLRTRLKPLSTLAVILPLAAAVMILFWPWVILAPQNFLISVDTFLNFPHPVPVLWDGETISSTHPPAGYLLLLLGMQMPEYLLLGVILAAICAGRAVRQGGVTLFTHHRAQQFLFIAGSALLPIIAFTILRPTAYNGMRHFLFIVPPLVILAAIGLDQALTYALRWRRNLAIALGLLLSLSFAREIQLMTSIHPYEYIAFNGINGSLAHTGQEFELDYWGTSLAEASEKLTDVVMTTQTHQRPFTPKPKVFVCGDRLSAEHFMSPALQITDKMSDADFFMAPLVALCDNLPNRPARTLFEVKRAGATLSRVLDLRPDANRKFSSSMPQR